MANPPSVPSGENKMGVLPIGPLLAGMALPMMASMLFQALYNVVDSFWVAKLGQDALNAVSLAFPLQNLMFSIGGGTGVGMNALLSRSLGDVRRPRFRDTDKDRCGQSRQYRYFSVSGKRHCLCLHRSDPFASVFPCPDRK